MMALALAMVLGASALGQTPTASPDDAAADPADLISSRTGEASMFPLPDLVAEQFADTFLAGDAVALIRLVGGDPSEAWVAGATNFDFSTYVAKEEAGEELSKADLATLEDWADTMVILLAIQAPGVSAENLLYGIVAMTEGFQAQEATIADRRFYHLDALEEYAWGLMYPHGDVLYLAVSMTEEPYPPQTLAALP